MCHKKAFMRKDTYGVREMRIYDFVKKQKKKFLSNYLLTHLNDNEIQTDGIESIIFEKKKFYIYDEEKLFIGKN